MPNHEPAVGATVEWYTPQSLFDRLDLTFDLDPASPARGPVPWVPAATFYSEAEDGLPWHGSVWLNPPYGPAAARFVNRMIEHHNGLMLLPARTETRTFQAALSAADQVCFLRDRLHFVREDGYQERSSFGSVLFAFGSRHVAALAVADLGTSMVVAL